MFFLIRRFQVWLWYVVSFCRLKTSCFFWMLQIWWRDHCYMCVTYDIIWQFCNIYNYDNAFDIFYICNYWIRVFTNSRIGISKHCFLFKPMLWIWLMTTTIELTLFYLKNHPQLSTMEKHVEMQYPRLIFCNNFLVQNLNVWLKNVFFS